MDKRPLIVVSLCAVGILFVSSLSSAVGYQTVKATMRTDIIEQSDSVRFKGTGDIVNKVGVLKHPLLFFIIYKLAQFRLNRGEFLYEISTSIGAFNWVDITHPVLFLRSCWLVFSTSEWLRLWETISLIMGWNWLV